MLDTIALTIIALLFSTALWSQAPTIEWSRTYGGSGSDAAIEIVPTSDGGYVTVGYTSSSNGDITENQGGFDYWIVKLDDNGDMQWQKTYGGSGGDHGQSIKQTNDGGFIALGYSRSTNGDVTGNHGDNDFWVIKIDATGNLEWNNSYGGFSDDFGREIQLTSDGGFIMTGFVYSIDGDVTGNHGDADFWVVKLDVNGNIQWQKTLGGTFGDEGDSLKQTLDGGYIVAGHSFSSDGDVLSGNQGLRDYWIVKLDSSGTIEWENSMGGSATEYGQSVIQTSGGEYILAGDSVSNDGDVTGNHGSADFWIVKLDASGNMLWQKSLGGSSDDNANSILETRDGGYTISGYAASNDGDVSGNHGGRDFWVTRLDVNGNLLWQKTMGGSSQDESESIALTNDQGYISCGFTASNNGDVSGNQGGLDFWIVKTTPDTLEVIEQDVLRTSVYPNPVIDFLHIEASEEIDQILVYNLLGQKVYDEVIFSRDISLNTTGFTEGIYMVQIISGNHSEVYRILKQN